MACALGAFLGLSIINFKAKALGALVAGTILQGIPCGMFGTLAATYTADVCPPAVGDFLTSCICACWAVGQVLSAGILWGVVDDEPEISIHMPMVVQWFIPPVVMLGCYLAPESPWHLARHGEYDKALSALKRLSSGSSQCDARERLVKIHELIRLEEEMHVGGTYQDCFRGFNRRRTEIAIMCSAGQLLAGFAIASEVVYFLQLAGLESRDSFKMAFFNSLVLLSGCALYPAVHAKLSLRSVYMLGMASMVPILFTIGLLEALERAGVPVQGRSVSWSQAALVFVWSLVYGATLGPVTNTIVCDVSASTLRPKTMALSRTVYDVLNLAQAAAGPYMLHRRFGNLEGFVALPAAGFAALWLLWAYFRLPEMDGIPAVLLDRLFRGHVPARRFPDQAARLRQGLHLDLSQPARDGTLSAETGTAATSLEGVEEPKTDGVADGAGAVDVDEARDESVVRPTTEDGPDIGTETPAP